MGKPFLWLRANPRQECLGWFTQLFDTGGGAWGCALPLRQLEALLRGNLSDTGSSRAQEAYPAGEFRRVAHFRFSRPHNNSGRPFSRALCEMWPRCCGHSRESALSGKISYGCLRLLLSQGDIGTRGEPQSTSWASQGSVKIDEYFHIYLHSFTIAV